MTKKTNIPLGSQKILTIALAIIIIASLGVVLYTTFVPPPNTEDITDSNPDQSSDSDMQKEPIVLTITADNITQQYTMTQVQNMESYTGFGGFRTSHGFIKSQGNYTGIKIPTLIEDIIDSSSFSQITVIATDGYSINYTYEEVYGNVSVFDASNASNEDPIGEGGVHMLLAYEFEGKPLNITTDGQLKIAYVNGSDAITSSKYWAKFVAEIQIILE